jgi:MFS family permease
MLNPQIKNEILKDRQIIKFKLYGFFKNLKFFEPFLLIFLLANNLSLLQIGLLIAIREIVVNVFEIPSGIIADYYGKKKELYFCFLFYIISFIFFFFTNCFLVAAIAMIFYGLGDAFRSGTHKALIFNYLDLKNWTLYKTFVYGRTRGASLIGSALSSLLAIVFILNMPSTNYIFLASIIPYILDFFLILSYPKEIDSKIYKLGKTNIQDTLKSMLKNRFKKTQLRSLIVSNSMFEASIASIKDYVQPILQTALLSSTFIAAYNVDKNMIVKIVLGITYSIIYLISSIGSRGAYKLIKYKSRQRLLNIMYLLLVVLLIILSFSIKSPYLVILLFLLIYLMRDSRKPIFVDVVDDNMDKKERATMLSIVSQIKSAFTIILAPLMGFIADKFGLSYSLITLSFILLITFSFTFLKSSKMECNL